MRVAAVELVALPMGLAAQVLEVLATMEAVVLMLYRTRVLVAAANMALIWQVVWVRQVL
jgi:hypothetical protein